METLIHYVTGAFWIVDFENQQVVRSRFLMTRDLAGSTIGRLLNLGAIGTGIIIRRTGREKRTKGKTWN